SGRHHSRQFFVALRCEAGSPPALANQAAMLGRLCASALSRRVPAGQCNWPIAGRPRSIGADPSRRLRRGAAPLPYVLAHSPDLVVPRQATLAVPATLVPGDPLSDRTAVTTTVAPSSPGCPEMLVEIGAFAITERPTPPHRICEPIGARLTHLRSPRRYEGFQTGPSGRRHHEWREWHHFQTRPVRSRRSGAARERYRLQRRR